MALPKTVKNMAFSGASAIAIASALLLGLENGPLPVNPAPYRDSAGIWTDCIGNTRDVNPNRIRSEKECLDLMNGEIERLDKEIGARTKVRPSVLTMASFISFAYNVGLPTFIGARGKNSILKRWNNGDHKGACQAMFLYNKVRVNGTLTYSPGLHNRRKVEYQACVWGLQ